MRSSLCETPFNIPNATPLLQLTAAAFPSE